MFYLFTTLVDLPNPMDFLASTTEWSSPFFNAFLPFVFMAGGILIAIGVVVFIIKGLGYIMHK